MRRLIIVVVAGLLAVAVPLAADAGSSHLRAQLHSTGGRSVRGTAAWSGMSEQNPIYLSVMGAKPSSQVVLRVCGPTILADTGAVHDQCWATFVDRDRHLTNIAVDQYGRANVALQPKLGMGNASLVRADRVELYPSGDVGTPIAVGKLTRWGIVFWPAPGSSTTRH